jgi:MinD-like ATPase involved in chromosome partitioning or flagellar assembly
MGRVPVVIAASGADWEASALDVLERGSSAVVLARRCVDLPDVLATAATGLATVAVVSPGLPGLDVDSVESLHRAGVSVLAVAHEEELLDGSAKRLRRLGVVHLLAASDIEDLPAAVVSASSATASSACATDEATRPTSRPAPEQGARRRGRTIAVWGPTGAPGRTTVAVGVASGIAGAGRETLLLDVDPYGGSVAQHLGVLDEASGLLGAARAANAGQLDRDRLEGTARRVSERFRVLTGLPRADRWPEVRPAAFADLLDEAARVVDHLVLDTGFSLEGDPVDPFGGTTPQRNQMTLTAIQFADEVVVVGSADPVGLARLARGLVELRDVVPTVRPRVVVNRTRPTLGWSDREVRAMVEGFLTPLGVHFLPDDRAAADRALMCGHSLSEERDSPLRTALAEIVHSILGEPAPRAVRGRLRRRASRRSVRIAGAPTAAERGGDERAAPSG